MPGEARRGRSTQCGEPVTFYAIYYQSEYNYTGTVQTFTAPVDGWYKVQLWGAAGGVDDAMETDGLYHVGGKGGYVEAEIKLTKGQIIYTYIGCPGKDNATASGAGYNGGGNPGTGGWSGSGGGASDIRVFGGEWNNPAGLSSRILVAGGGGGGGLFGNGGHGGGLIGGSGDEAGGTQTSAGNRGGFGYGGTNGRDGGGGGGGWYGGGASNSYDGGGGGGSSYIGGYGSIPIRNAYTKAGNEAMPGFTGGTMIGNSGPCHARFLIVEWV